MRGSAIVAIPGGIVSLWGIFEIIWNNKKVNQGRLAD